MSTLHGEPDEGAVEVAEEEVNGEVPDNDPTEYIPVMRHHLHETLLAVNHAHNKQMAEDLATAYRDGREVGHSSQLANRLGRAAFKLEGYLGLRDEENDERQSVSEDE